MASKEVLVLKEAAVYLDMTDSYLYKLTSGRSIPHYCPAGKRIYFKRSELDQWMLSNRHASEQELASNVLSNLFRSKEVVCN